MLWLLKYYHTENALKRNLCVCIRPLITYGLETNFLFPMNIGTKYQTIGKQNEVQQGNIINDIDLADPY